MSRPTRDYAAIAAGYVRSVISGEIPAGKWTIAACQRQSDDLARQDSDEFPWLYDPTKGSRVCGFVERCPHIKGRKFAGKPLILEPWQVWLVMTAFSWVSKVSGLRRFRRVYVEVAKGNGKALALDTPVPTLDGLKPLADVHPGDFVFGSDGNVTEVIAESEVFDGDCYEVTFSTGEKIIADANHLWRTSSLVNDSPLKSKGRTIQSDPSTDIDGSYYSRVRTTSQIADTLFAGGTQGGTPLRNHRVKVCPPVESPERLLSIHPYVLGVWLGDGGSHDARFTSADIEIVKRVARHETVRVCRDLGDDLACSFRMTTGTRSKEDRAASCQSRLRELGVLRNKHIPEPYFLGSREQRLELLRGLMDTDGYVDKAGQCYFYNCNERLARDVHRLLASLGFKPSFTSKPACLNGKVVGTCWIVCFRAYRDVPVFHLHRKRTRQVKRPSERSLQNYRIITNVRRVDSVPVKCITVAAPDGLFAVTGSYILTHNSPLAAALSQYMAFADGEPGAEVYTAAHGIKQARIVFDTARAMAEAMPRFRKVAGVEVGQHSIFCQRSNSSIKPLSREAKLAEGSLPYFVVTDELHVWPKRELFDNLVTAVAKRDNAMMFSITTAGTDLSSVCHEQHEYLSKILDGVLEDDSYFGCIWAADDGDDPWAESTWRKANPNWGVSVNPESIAAEAKRAKQLPSAQAAFQTKHLDIWLQTDHAWLDIRRFKQCADPSLKIEDFIGQPCVIGLDLASKLDLLAKVRLFWKQIDGKRHIYAFGTYWTPEARLEANAAYRGWAIEGHLETVPGATNDYDLVEDAIRADAKRFQVLEVAHDPYQAIELTNHLTTERVPMVEVPQVTRNFDQAMKEFEGLVQSGCFHYDGDPVLAWAFSNVVCHPDRNDCLFPNKAKPENKIDPATALLTALARVIALAATGKINPVPRRTEVIQFSLDELDEVEL